jgi:hypothetical protein
MLVECLYRRVVMARWRSTYQSLPLRCNSCLPPDIFAAACAEMTHPHWVNRPEEGRQSDEGQETAAAVAASIYDSGWSGPRSARLRCD